MTPHRVRIDSDMAARPGLGGLRPVALRPPFGRPISARLRSLRRTMPFALLRPRFAGASAGQFSFGKLAARPGFEPGLGESKSPVLPLHHQARNRAEERAAQSLIRSRAESSPFALGS